MVPLDPLVDLLQLHESGPGIVTAAQWAVDGSRRATSQECEGDEWCEYRTSAGSMGRLTKHVEKGRWNRVHFPEKVFIVSEPISAHFPLVS